MNDRMKSKTHEEQLFTDIVSDMVIRYDDVEQGPMMSSPGIRYKGKVFAFYLDNRMCFRLGKDFDLTPFGISYVKHLSPFKKKPPMKAWYLIDSEDSISWAPLAEAALTNMM